MATMFKDDNDSVGSVGSDLKLQDKDKVCIGSSENKVDRLT